MVLLVPNWFSPQWGQRQSLIWCREQDLNLHAFWALDPKSNASANSAIPASCSRVYLFGLTGRVASKIDGNFDQFSISIPGKPSRSCASRLVGLKSSSGLVKQRHDRILRKEVYRANEELMPQGWHQGGKAG